MTATAIRVALFQNRVPSYRVGVFSRLGREPDLDLTVYATSYEAPIPHVESRTLVENRIGPLRIHRELFSSRFRAAYDVALVEGRLSLLASIALVESQLPVVWWTSLWRKDGTIGTQHGPLGLVTRRALRRASSIVTYSRAAKEAAVRSGAPPERVFVAPNSLDTSQLLDAEASWRADPEALARHLLQRGIDSSRAALFLGRLIPDKRLDFLVRAWALVVERHPREAPLLVVVGDGRERSSMADLAHRLGIQGRVLFLGDVRDVRRVCPFILAARALVLPGAGGLAVNQAMTHGLPTIVGGGDGTEGDVIEDGVNGFIERSGDLGEFAKRIEELLYCSDERWASYSHAAREAIRKNANLDLMIRGLAGAVRVAVGRPPAPEDSHEEPTLLECAPGGA